MYIAAHEWSRPENGNGLPRTTKAPFPAVGEPCGNGATAQLYRRLADRLPGAGTDTYARDFLRTQIAALDPVACELPDAVDDLSTWMLAGTQRVTEHYALYLQQRKAGGPRRYFSNRAHALYFLKNAAPTKLVDGAWLYGLVQHWRNPRLADLLRTYLEELGDGAPDKNHVLLYRRLLDTHGLDGPADLPDALYLQGALQLALAHSADEFLPEIIGFNLAYEQLPLHLLITAYELNELGIDPYYFTLHVTVDNADTGHAQRAVNAVRANLPRFGDRQAFWRRIRAGAQLADAGISTSAIIDGFDIEREVIRIFARKSTAGRGAHSDYCRVAGRSINNWLGQPAQMAEFLGELQKAGWIRRGEAAANSRLWGLLQGPQAEMFGVFSAYELQVIHDWIRGPASCDGQPFAEAGKPDAPQRRPSYRAAARLAAARQGAGMEQPDAGDLDSDLPALIEQLAAGDAGTQEALLIAAMSPSQHWTPAGLYATRQFCARTLQGLR